MNRASTLSAPVGLLPLSRPLMISEVLDAAVRLFRAGLVRCLPYSGLAVLLMLLPPLYSTFQGGGGLLVTFRVAGPFASIYGFSGFTDVHLVALVVAVFAAALFGMITLRLLAIARGVRPSFRAEVSTALRRWPAAVIASLAALAFPAMMFTALSLFNFMYPNPLLPMVAALLLLPSALFAVTLPAFWADRLGPLEAVARALRVSSRSLWRMTGAILATTGMVLVLWLLAAALFAMVTPLLGRADLFLFATVSALFTLIWGALGVPFVLAVLCVAYADLKLRAQQRRGDAR